MLNRWEDGPIVAAMDSPPEQLFRPDGAIVAWRRWCHENARRAPSEVPGAYDVEPDARVVSGPR